MQPLTLPEVRRIEKLLSEMRKGETLLIAENRDEGQVIVNQDLMTRVLVMALVTNDALVSEWRKYEK